MNREHMEHGMAPPGRDHQRDDARKRMGRLEALRARQSLLARMRERELAEQRAHDAHAQHLMETDPQGHIEMMRPMQEHKALVRDLPAALLEREAAVYQDVASSTQARPPEPMWDPLMTGMVVGEKWVHLAVMPLGLWLIASPSALAYRSAALAWSDLLSGTLIVVLAALTYAGLRWAPWTNAAVGLWVMFAPLAFWAPDPASYANDTLAGALVVGLAVIAPMRMPMPGPDVPPEWSYNPSSWTQRAPIVALAVVSFSMARYMAAFQLEHIPAAWDPFFGRGTERILTSEVSRAFPISDAGLGAYTYIIEILSGLMGDSRRWRAMPWMVAMFGFVVVPLGITSVVLIILQPLAVGAWCTLCLISAFQMLVMVALSLDEVVAMIQYLVITRRAGHSAWVTFWNGGTMSEQIRDLGLARRQGGPWREMWWGTTAPWPLLAVTLLGMWLMASPISSTAREARPTAITCSGRSWRSSRSPPGRRWPVPCAS